MPLPPSAPSISSSKNSLVASLEKYEEVASKAIGLLESIINKEKKPQSNHLRHINTQMLLGHFVEVLLAYKWAETFSLKNAKGESLAPKLNSYLDHRGFTREAEVLKPYYSAADDAFNDIATYAHEGVPAFIQENLINQFDSAYEALSQFGSLMEPPFVCTDEKGIKIMSRSCKEWVKTRERIKKLTPQTPKKYSTRRYTSIPQGRPKTPEESTRVSMEGKAGGSAPITPNSRDLRGKVRRSSGASSRMSGSSGGITSSPIAGTDSREELQEKLNNALFEKAKLLSELARIQEDNSDLTTRLSEGLERQQVVAKELRDALGAKQKFLTLYQDWKKEAEQHEDHIGHLKANSAKKDSQIQELQKTIAATGHRQALNDEALQRARTKDAQKIEKLEKECEELRAKNNEVWETIREKEQEKKELEEQAKSNQQKIKSFIDILRRFNDQEPMNEEADCYEEFLALVPELQGTLTENDQLKRANSKLQAHLQYLQGEFAGNAQDLNARIEIATEAMRNTPLGQAFTSDAESTLDEHIKTHKNMRHSEKAEALQEHHQLTQMWRELAHRVSTLADDILPRLQAVENKQRTFESPSHPGIAKTIHDLSVMSAKFRMLPERRRSRLSLDSNRYTSPRRGLPNSYSDSVLRTPVRDSRIDSFPFESPGISRSSSEDSVATGLASPMSDATHITIPESKGFSRFPHAEEIEEVASKLLSVCTHLDDIQNKLQDQEQKDSNVLSEILLLKGESTLLNIEIQAIVEQVNKLQSIEDAVGTLRKAHIFEALIRSMRDVGVYSFLSLQVAQEVFKRLKLRCEPYLSPNEDGIFENSREELELNKAIKHTEKMLMVSCDETATRNIPLVIKPWIKITADFEGPVYQAFDVFAEADTFKWGENTLNISHKALSKGKEQATLRLFRKTQSNSLEHGGFFQRIDPDLEETILSLAHLILSTAEKNPNMVVTLEGEEQMVCQLTAYLYAAKDLYRTLSLKEPDFVIKTPQLKSVPRLNEAQQQQAHMRILRGIPLIESEKPTYGPCALKDELGDLLTRAPTPSSVIG